MKIDYTVSNEENIKRLKQFSELKHLESHEIEEKLEMDHSHDEIECWQKVLACIWCWKSFMHDKHEAFRFKYDTKAMSKVENELMPNITIMLYVNSIVYYLIMFGAPLGFANECGEGLQNTSHYIYAGYAMATILLEVFVVKKIESTINDENVLQLNKWHVVEIVFG